MPDHVHLILQPIEANGKVESLGDIVGDIKRFASHNINKLIGRKGSLWLSESYDRIIRDEKEYRKVSQYIFENPVKKGFVENGEDWKRWRAGIEPVNNG